MNKVNIIGRFCKDMDIMQTANGTSVLKNTVAINRRYKKDESDFINVVFFGKTAEFVNQYFQKGDLVGVSGRIQTGSFENKEGKRIYTTDVIAEEVSFCGKTSGTRQKNYEEEIDTNDLPF